MIVPYSLLSENPATEARILWIDDRDDADGSDQTIELDGNDTTVSGEEVPERAGTYLYDATIDGLNGGTKYTGEIDSERSIEYKTPPTDASDLKVAVISDTHLDSSGRDNMSTPEPLNHLGSTEPDVAMFNGDMLTHRQEKTSTAADLWVEEFFEEYWQEVENGAGRLVPLMTSCGNHEGGGWEEDHDGGHYRFFFRPDTFEPTGTDYYQISVGEVQLISFACYNANPYPDIYGDFEAQGDWLEENLDDTAKYIVAMGHVTIVPARSHTSWDSWELDPHESGNVVPSMEKYLMPHLSDAPAQVTCIGGHVHSYMQTVRVSYQDDAPDTDDYYDVPEGGYIVPDDEGIFVFGEGWSKDGRDPLSRDDWAIDNVSIEKYNNWHTIEFGNSVTVTDYDENGNTIDSHWISDDGLEWSLRSESKWSVSSDSEWTMNQS